MADTTSYHEDLPREEAAELLEGLARELRGRGPADVQVGNKTVRVSPGNTVEYDIELEERSPMFGGNREELNLSLAWETSDES